MQDSLPQYEDSHSRWDLPEGKRRSLFHLLRVAFRGAFYDQSASGRQAASNASMPIWRRWRAHRLASGSLTRSKGLNTPSWNTSLACRLRSGIRFNLLQPDQSGFIGLENIEFFVTDPSFWPAVLNTMLLLGSVIVLTVFIGVLVGLLTNEPFAGRGVVRVLLISLFFVMPTVNALLWKNMMMNPIYGVFAQVWQIFGATPVDWLTDYLNRPGN